MSRKDDMKTQSENLLNVLCLKSTVCRVLNLASYRERPSDLVGRHMGICVNLDPTSEKVHFTRTTRTVNLACGPEDRVTGN